jgi:uncharacterized protein
MRFRQEGARSESMVDKASCMVAQRPMHLEISLFLQALGLALVIEGIPYFLWAERMPAFFRMLSQLRPSVLRVTGLGLLLSGLLLLFSARG